jgi:hypothetical protein
MERRSRRIKSLLIHSSNLGTLSEPINKNIKPTQIYNDYDLPVVTSNTSSISLSNSKRNTRYNSITSNPCSCDCHGKYSLDRTVSASNTRRKKLLSPSPSKFPNPMSRKSSNNSTIFPYKSYDSRVLPSLPGIKKSYDYGKKIINLRKYLNK